MKNLNKSEFDKIYKDGKNLTGKPIFINFYADWWGPCKFFEQVLNQVIPDYKDKINMYKVDIEKEEELAAMTGTRSIPYIIFISKNGDGTYKVGGLNEDQLKYYFEGLISKK